MALYSMFNPIAVEKPVRGREMRTTVIPKETMKAMKVVSTKALQDEFIKLEDNKMGDYPEIYHEGYIDGKLYLVPDNNLQAMRDIVNKKMKRQQGGNKIKYSIDETSKYNEFSTKFDTLMEKIDQFAESSSEDLSNSADNKESLKKTKSTKVQNTTNEGKVCNLNERKVEDYKYASSGGNTNDRVSVEGEKNKTEFDCYGDIVPPLLDEKIKYRKVKPSNLLTREYEIQPFADTEQYYKRTVPKPSQFTDIDSDDWNHPIIDPDSEIYRFLISGHLKSHSSPMFIIHQNYIGPNILENYIPDFKSHKREGNVHIFISGKFFPHDILVDETITSSAALSIPPYIIPINNNNTIWEERFKDVYDLGPVDISLEGEFIKDNTTLQYTPIISLDIIKHEQLLNDSDCIITPTMVLYSKQIHSNPFKDKNDKNKTRKHVHYATTEQTELKGDHSDEGGKQKSKWKSVKDLIKTITTNNLFSKSKHNINRYIASNEDIRVTSSQENELIQSIIKMRKPLQLKQRFRGKSGQRRRHRILEEIREDKMSDSKIITVPDNLSAIPEKRGSLEQRPSSKKASSTKKKKKVKKEDGNQAIVENPILAQMQEFFIA